MGTSSTRWNQRKLSSNSILQYELQLEASWAIIAISFAFSSKIEGTRYDKLGHAYLFSGLREALSLNYNLLRLSTASDCLVVGSRTSFPESWGTQETDMAIDQLCVVDDIEFLLRSVVREYVPLNPRRTELQDDDGDETLAAFRARECQGTFSMTMLRLRVHSRRL